MRIGELASRAGLNVQTLRFYEREGLLRPPVRTASGYRSYADSDLERVRFIRLCQGLGFTLREIQQLLILHKSVADYRGTLKMQPAAVGEIVTLANDRLTVIGEKIVALKSMQEDLTSLVNALTGGGAKTCPVSRDNTPDNSKIELDLIPRYKPHNRF
jgi:MerR family copper efflux transcriptional regulator